jgi:hypothetical protein
LSSRSPSRPAVDALPWAIESATSCASSSRYGTASRGLRRVPPQRLRRKRTRSAPGPARGRGGGSDRHGGMHNRLSHSCGARAGLYRPVFTQFRPAPMRFGWPARANKGDRRRSAALRRNFSGATRRRTARRGAHGLISGTAGRIHGAGPGRLVRWPPRRTAGAWARAIIAPLPLAPDTRSGRRRTAARSRTWTRWRWAYMDLSGLSSMLRSHWHGPGRLRLA